MKIDTDPEQNEKTEECVPNKGTRQNLRQRTKQTEDKSLR